jgi:nitroreductase
MNEPDRADVLETLLQERFSCRGFLPDPVTREDVERLLRMAQRTASWCNAQPWQLHVLSSSATERARRELLAHVGTASPAPDLPFPETYSGVYRERRRECGFQLYGAVGVTRGDTAGAQQQRLENFRFFGAPHVALVTADRSLGTYAAVDCGAYVGNFLLSARALGIATIAQAALASHADFWREHLSLSEDRLVVCGISFGYEDRRHPANSFRTSRASIEDAVVFVD